MSADRATVLVTGVAGDLGNRLVPTLRAAGCSLVGVDIHPPSQAGELIVFQSADLGREESCDTMARLIRETGAQQVIHLAFVLDPRKAGIFDEERVWQINVAGTARVMEAITEANRRGARVRQFIHVSSVAAYGPHLPVLATERHPLEGDGPQYARHAREADIVVQQRAATLGNRCSAVILRAQLFSGPEVHNYMLDALRGLPSARSTSGRKLIEKSTKLPIVMPWGTKWRERQIQFVHIDDVARVVAWFVAHPLRADAVEAFNVAGRGATISIEEAAQITGAPIKQLPSRAAVGWALQAAWRSGVSDLPPDALPYVLGEYTLSTEKLRQWLGNDYESVIQYTSTDALRAALIAPA